MELLKKAQTAREIYFVMSLIAASYVQSVDAKMIPDKRVSNWFVPEVSDEAIFATNFQDSPDYRPEKGFPESRWLEHKELRKALEDLSRVNPETDQKLLGERNGFIPLNAIRVLSYGKKAKSTTTVIDDFVAFAEDNEAAILPQLTDEEQDRYLKLKFHLAISYVIYHGWDALPKVTDWLSLREGEWVPRWIIIELLSLVGDMAYIDRPPEAHSHYLDFFSEIFKRCNLSGYRFVFRKGLKNIPEPEKATELLDRVSRACDSE